MGCETNPLDSRPTTRECPGYANPLEFRPRWYLIARARAIRSAASLGFRIANRTDPPAPSPTRNIWLDASVSKAISCRAHRAKSKIKAEVWMPPSPTFGTRAAIVNFHGGGWILGQGTDDARWAGAIMSDLDAVVFTVNYRLAPKWPFPAAIEDCVDAVLQIKHRAVEFGIDPDRIILSGFSSGATNALASWLILNDPDRWDYKLPIKPPKIAGITLFYPLLDWTIPRPEKRRTCVKPEFTLPKSLTDLIDACFIYPNIPREGRSDPRLSPGLMTDEMLMKLPPIHLVLCEYDMLLSEGLRFSNRLQAAGKQSTLRLVKGERHAWDRPPPVFPKESVAIEYQEATTTMRSWFAKKHKHE
ncbi:hypothetical protein FOMG_19580 [Fusarium oxysporum f. sp. melonis 26406]|uniref:Alpha/beta hydrolase fold-3 domain-containing protein n=1 Tax=Fusarium oxysporum f. sp. melonis 26406 TaxID=1089452 RepID=W9YVR4_FUSOX|nr:hypothetical protein FOMG_19580 [Fusarium oxysporum f. sp. melonis 26406]